MQRRRDGGVEREEDKREKKEEEREAREAVVSVRGRKDQTRVGRTRVDLFLTALEMSGRLCLSVQLGKKRSAKPPVFPLSFSVPPLLLLLLPS